MNEQILRDALQLCHESLRTYGEHIIIDKAVKYALEVSNNGGWHKVANNDYPEFDRTVWITNGNWVALGCRVIIDGEWFWAQSNGIVYSENGQIVSECEIDDLDVTHWHEIPTLPQPTTTKE